MSFIKSWPFIRRVCAAVAVAAILVGALVAIRGASPGVEVLVAAKDLSEGQAVDARDFTVVPVPADAAPADALVDPSSVGAVWQGPAIRRGTVVTESIVDGSPAARGLEAGRTRVTVMLDATHLPLVEAGDSVDLWTAPRECDETVCAASLLAGDVLIASISNEDSSQWEASASARVDLIVDSADIRSVLGYAGTGTLSLVLRGSHPGHRATE